MSANNKAKTLWIITDDGVLPADNDIKTALNAVYSNNASASFKPEDGPI